MQAYLLLGTNLGNREQNLQQAIAAIKMLCGKLTASSSVYTTAAWGITHQPDFLNQVICIDTTLSAQQLIKLLLDIEKKLGRKRIVKMGPRLIDIDILLMENTVIHEPDLIIPHPRMQQRKFVLIPLNEIAPAIIHPVFNKTISQLLKDCEDNLDVKKF